MFQSKIKLKKINQKTFDNPSDFLKFVKENRTSIESVEKSSNKVFDCDIASKYTVNL